MLEVLMVAGVMALLMVILVSMTSTSVARNKESTQKTVATQLAQEGMDWLRKERDRVGWIQVKENIGTGAATQVCLTDAAKKISEPLGAANCLISGLSENYYRSIIFTFQDLADPEIDYYEVVIEVDWDKSSQQEPVRLEGKLYAD